MADSIEAKLAMSLDELLKQRALASKGAVVNNASTSTGKRAYAGGNGTCVGKRCYVGNLAFRTSWQDLKDHFRQVGNVVYTKVIQDEATGSSKGCGIVEFEKPEEAARAIEQLHDKELSGRMLIVREDREDRDLKPGKGGGKGASEGLKRARTTGSFGGPPTADFSESRRVYVGNLSYRTSWQDLKDHFRQVGKVVYSNVMEESPGRSKGCGIVEFESAAEAAEAIRTLHDSQLNSRQIFVREDREDREVKAASRAQGKGAGTSRRVYVGNLSYRTSWQDLKDHFKQIGKVVYSNVLEESGTKRSKGCGIVEFETPAEAAKAIEELHDSELQGRPIFVREDREDRDLLG